MVFSQNQHHEIEIEQLAFAKAEQLYGPDHPQVFRRALVVARWYDCDTAYKQAIRGKLSVFGCFSKFFEGKACLLYGTPERAQSQFPMEWDDAAFFAAT